MRLVSIFLLVQFVNQGVVAEMATVHAGHQTETEAQELSAARYMWDNDVDQTVDHGEITRTKNKRSLIKKVIGTAIGVGAGVLGYKVIKSGFKRISGKDSSGRHHRKFHHHHRPHPLHHGHYGHHDHIHGHHEIPMPMEIPVVVEVPVIVPEHQFEVAVPHHLEEVHHHHNAVVAVEVPTMGQPQYEHQQIIEHDLLDAPRPQQVVHTSTCIDRSNECHGYIDYCVKKKVKMLCPKTCGYCS